MLNVLLEKFEPCQACGYDIGCSMDGTCSRSKLGPTAAERELMILVNAFHGYPHAYVCQLVHDPMVIPGAGLEDFAPTLYKVLSNYVQPSCTSTKCPLAAARGRFGTNPMKLRRPQRSKRQERGVAAAG